MSDLMSGHSGDSDQKAMLRMALLLSSSRVFQEQLDSWNVSVVADEVFEPEPGKQIVTTDGEIEVSGDVAEVHLHDHAFT